ncbi:MAG: hypothetical protein PHE58_01320, partial [Candidatus Omnitrophica bacterium]|nr:hypothetical protein [Candidatus Omnitrophota bacterium]
MTLEEKHGYSSQAKQYSNHKYAVSILQTIFLIVILSLFVGTGAAKNLAVIVTGVFTPFFFAFAVYLGILYFVYFLVDFPLNFYQSFILEHRYFLTKQKITDWFKDQAKGGVVFFILSFISLSLFYYVMGHSPQYWWIVISLFWIFFSVVLAQIAPVVILPLFFKYKPFTDEGLKQRIMILAEKIGVNVCDVYEIDFSRKTLKANAAFQIGR